MRITREVMAEWERSGWEWAAGHPEATAGQCEDYAIACARDAAGEARTLVAQIAVAVHSGILRQRGGEPRERSL